MPLFLLLSYVPWRSRIFSAIRVFLCGRQERWEICYLKITMWYISSDGRWSAHLDWWRPDVSGQWQSSDPSFIRTVGVHNFCFCALSQQSMRLRKDRERHRQRKDKIRWHLVGCRFFLTEIFAGMRLSGSRAFFLRSLFLQKHWNTVYLCLQQSNGYWQVPWTPAASATYFAERVGQQKMATWLWTHIKTPTKPTRSLAFETEIWTDDLGV